MAESKQSTLGWGTVNESGVEIWDMQPVFRGPRVTLRDRLLLLCYPKKFLLYRWIGKARKQENKKTRKQENRPFRILDVGCGTGATIIDLKKLFARSVDVVGVDVVRLEVDLANEKIKKHGVWAQAQWFDGQHLPFPDASFDAIYSSDVLGHVQHVPTWLRELSRVLKSGGVLAMFSESALGRHAYIRNYLFRRGVNIDPHAEFHISLYSKAELKSQIEQAGFDIAHMYSAIWPSFFLYPDMYARAMSTQDRFPILRRLNRWLLAGKKRLHPASTAAVELYSLIEMLTLGRFVESQGYIVLAKKR